jgi:hypothetical protein
MCVLLIVQLFHVSLCPWSHYDKWILMNGAVGWPCSFDAITMMTASVQPQETTPCNFDFKDVGDNKKGKSSLDLVGMCAADSLPMFVILVSNSGEIIYAWRSSLCEYNHEAAEKLREGVGTSLEWQKNDRSFSEISLFIQTSDKCQN